MRSIKFVADFFVEQGVHGGAEICNDELIKMLTKDGHTIEKINSDKFMSHHINNESFYIVANFMNLSEHNKDLLSERDYIILEHDHKYVSTNDPSKFVNMIAPSSAIINKKFYNKAKAVLCQSIIHAETLQKNLLIKNIVNLGGNLWSDERLEMLSKLIGTNKTRKTGILFSRNKNKGMPFSVDYCNKNNIDFEFIQPSSYQKFIQEIAKTERIVFFPQWLESFNRVMIEARILNCRVTTNKLVGCTYEPWFKKYKGKELIKFLKFKRQEIHNVFSSLINNKPVSFISDIKVPKVSIITSLFKGGKYIEHFMSEVTKQTIFDNCELIILDANSPDEEYKVIEKYCKEYSNIRYFKLNETPTVQSTMNMGIKEAQGEFLTLWNVDDTRRYDALELMAKTLFVDDRVELVYADSYQTGQVNVTFDSNDNFEIYEHSQFEFSKENMIKCLPGPLPMWKKKMTDNNGLFNESFTYAGDWEMWLRCVENGSRFKKINEVLGLYYYNPDGLSTSDQNHEKRFAEERQLFHKYKHMFGRNTAKYEGYFK